MYEHITPMKPHHAAPIA